MSVFASENELKEAILANTPDDFVDQFILGRDTHHFPVEKMEYVAEVFADEYGVGVTKDELMVVGSSKLGFATHDKRKNGTVVSLAYRSFGENSDIDLSLCSPSLFRILWHEISAYYNQMPQMPYRHRRLGDYLAYGWLRSDQLPVATAPHLVKCSNLRIVRSRIRKNRQKGHPMVDIGVFHDMTHLKLYQARSIGASKQKLEAPL